MDRRVVLFLLLLTVFTGFGFLYNTIIKNTGLTNTSGSRIPILQYTTIKESKEEKLGPTPVVILTYARSGSSFLGDMIGLLPENVIYLFEPLHFLRYSDPLTYFNRTSKRTVFGIHEMKEVIKNIMTCQFTELPLEFWNAAFITKHSQQVQSFYSNNGLTIQRRTENPEQFKTSLENFQMECKHTKAIVIKTIRTPLFILKIPKLRIIHLMRDPRSAIFSQNQHIVHFNSISIHANQLCTRILNDVSVANMLSIFYPSNIIRVRYEFVAKYPVKMAELLFKYLGLSFTEKIIKLIFNMTSSGETVEGLLSTTKGNSSEEVDKWRETIDMSEVQSVDDQCRTLYRKLGYVPVANVTMLRNKSIPLFYKLEKATENSSVPYLVDFFADKRMIDEFVVK